MCTDNTLMRSSLCYQVLSFTYSISHDDYVGILNQIGARSRIFLYNRHIAAVGCNLIAQERVGKLPVVNPPVTRTISIEKFIRP